MLIGRKPLNNKFAKVDRNQRGKNKPKGNKDGDGWIANDKLENFRLNVSRCANRDVAPLRNPLGNTG